MTQTAPALFRQFVVKVHSRCDLACDHCYVYEHADQSWRARPRVLSLDTAAAIGQRVAEYAKTNSLSAVKIVLHGGEPLLAGAEHLRALIETLVMATHGVTELDLRVHTNGVRLDTEFCDLLREYGVRVGISLDGDRAANDRHRRYADGRTSHPQVLRALELLRRPDYRHLFAGILCTIDVSNDPIAVYEALRAEQPPRVDFLLPHATWDTPPVRPSDSVTGEPVRTAYADWLITIYDRWIADGRPFGVRVFESIRSTLAGGPPLTEALGLAPSDVLVIETDGDIEQVDSLKTAFDGAPATGLNVLVDDIAAAADHPGLRARALGLAGLSKTCQACPVVASCGGGLFPHRYRSESGFDNPSVYCDDLFKLVTHVSESERPSAATEADNHTLPAPHIRELTAGFGGAGAISSLAATQYSINRMLLAEAAERLVHSDPPLRAAWNTLVEIDAARPDAVDHVLSHPYFRAWAAGVLGSSSPISRGYYLPALAISAAARAEVETELFATIKRQRVYLPTLGLIFAGEQQGTVRVRTSDGRLNFEAAGRSWTVETRAAEAEPGSPWRPSVRLRSGGFATTLEDADPERDCHQWPADQLLSAEQRAAWQDAFDTAWQLIRRDHAAYLPGLEAGLRAITPLAPSRDAHEISATARHAFGAVGAALPSSADRLALLLIHEFQHVKLGAVLDGYALFDESDTRLYYAPWRPDPRPLEGLLQGTYAHVAVTDFWRVRRLRAADEQQSAAAEAHFARWREHTAQAVEVLRDSGSLTALGLEFAEGMSRTLSPWLAESVSAEALSAAQHSSQVHRTAFEAAMRQSADA
ncbi:MAG TPA: FxsB family cyclophane-forming radical SAM/SPASM peptide maturase [Actinocrinis sp.]|uniref:FxsB family cyclophane-forming radical SAM/SPASM peptide maturase n=1 Tax=Actinocrinis sp. TaxID=1920516 RepID=UPI002D291E93|nr:FxsB family cyclophane-forming radical SAM/SPASM peptide maturase [Actinocrinis sp.]HZU58226.1 FxsB family cyclophane-forming radical SAM/SPASM peptide maturase [Actinocrinis sp.]